MGCSKNPQFSRKERARNGAPVSRELNVEIPALFRKERERRTGHSISLRRKHSECPPSKIAKGGAASVVEFIIVSGFEGDVTDAADYVVGGTFALGDGDDLDRLGLVVRAKDYFILGGFDISYGASIAFQNSVHIPFIFPIRPK
jgi:hypothetical protein